MKPAPPVTRIGPCMAGHRNPKSARPRSSGQVPDVVLPVLNEREALPWVLERMPDGYVPIVVDNGSTDGSADVARALGARGVGEPRPGCGAACFAGLSAARDDIVCFMDCDASFDPRELPRVASPVATGEADLVLGARVRGGPLQAHLANRALGAGVRGGPLHARLANRALAWE